MFTRFQLGYVLTEICLEKLLKFRFRVPEFMFYVFLGFIMFLGKFENSIMFWNVLGLMSVFPCLIQFYFLTLFENCY